MAAGSAQEMEVWIDFCQDLNYLNKQKASELVNEYAEISKMLNGLIKNWKDN